MKNTMIEHFIHNNGFEYWRNMKNQYERNDGGPFCIWIDGSEMYVNTHLFNSFEEAFHDAMNKWVEISK